MIEQDPPDFYNKKSRLLKFIPLVIIVVGGGLVAGVFVIPMFEDKIPMETVYTLEIDDKTVYEIVIDSTDKSQWDVQNSNIMINGTSYSLELFTETEREKP